MARANESQLLTQAKIELEQTERIVLMEGTLRREEIVTWVRLSRAAGQPSFTAPKRSDFPA